MNNSYVHVNMTGQWNILIFTTIFSIFQLTNSQPNTSNLTQATLQEYCLTGNGSLIRLKNLNDSGSLIELLTRPMWSSIDGNNTPWIADIGCYDIGTVPKYHKQPQKQTANTIEGCYLECHKDYINCGKNESIYFALKESRSFCFCFCNIQELISHSNECDKSCSLDQQCRSKNYYSVYTEYAIENKGSDGFCLICSNRDKIPDANVSDFGCDGEPLGMCVAMEDNCYEMKEDNGNLTFSNTDCEQHLPIICQKYNEMKDRSLFKAEKTSVVAESPSLTLTKDTLVIILSVSGTTIAVCVFLLLYYRVLRERCRKSRTSHVHLDNIGQITNSNTPGQPRSKADSKAQNWYQTIVPNCRNNHFYDHIQKSEQENGPKFVKVH